MLLKYLLDYCQKKQHIIKRNSTDSHIRKIFGNQNLIEKNVMYSSFDPKTLKMNIDYATRKSKQ